MAVAHWPRRPVPSARPASIPQLEGVPLARSLKASRETSPLHRSRPVPEYGACRFRRACAVKRVAEAVSGILPREDKAIAIRVLSLSEPSASRSGPAVSTLMRKVPGLMLPSGPPMAALTNGGPLAETRRCISPHVFAAVMARSRRLLSAVRPWRCRWRPTRIARKTLEPRPARGHRSRRRLATEACPSAYAPRGGGAKDLRPDLERRARP
jgi:hypothetical protein